MKRISLIISTLYYNIVENQYIIFFSDNYFEQTFTIDKTDIYY